MSDGSFKDQDKHYQHFQTEDATGSPAKDTD